jgi:argininosuccinate synthase
MDQASTSAAFTNDKVRVGTVLAAAMIAKAAMSIATAEAINLTGEGCKLKGVDATEHPHQIHETGPP